MKKVGSNSYSRHIARSHIRLLKSRVIKAMEKFLEETKNKSKINEK